MAEKVLVISETDQETPEDDVFDVETQFKSFHLQEPISTNPTWLQNVESPFNWLPIRFSDVPSKEVITKATERIQMDEGFDATFPFEKLVRILTLVYEYSYHGKEKKAWEKLNLCEQLVDEEKDKDVSTYKQLEEALTHTLHSTKAHLLFRDGKISESKELAENIKPVSTMDNDSQAAMQAVRARFFYLYRSQGVKLVVQYAREALKLAPDKPLWQVLTAEAIRRLRKFLPATEQLSNEEVPLLERAVSVQRNARHLVLLAQAYRERGDAIYKQHRSELNFFQSQTFLDISDIQAKAFALYKEALSLKPDDEVVNRLCGYGLLKLPAFKSDYRLAQRCLQKALEQSPNNPTTIHSLGLYYYKGLMEYEKAAFFCEKAGKLGNFPASLDMLRMKRLVYESNYDPVFDFGKLLKQYGDDSTKRHEVLCQMGSYYMFFERDLPKALKYFRILIKENAEQSIITSHKCTFLNMSCKINLFECIVNEGLRLIQNSEKLSEELKDESSLLDVKNFLDELRTSQHNLFDTPLNINLIDELHKVSDDIKQTYVRKKERRESYKEKRRASSSGHSSFDEIPVPSRRQSEGGDMYRRKSSGNVSDTTQNRTFKSSTICFNKQGSCDSGIYNCSDGRENGKEQYTSYKKPLFYRSHSYNSEKNYGSFRRRSSGSTSELGRNTGYNNKPTFSREIYDIKEVFPPGERYSEHKPTTEKNFLSSQSKRMSWSGSSTIQENPKLKVQN